MIPRISRSFYGDRTLSFNDEISCEIDNGRLRYRQIVEPHPEKAVVYDLRRGLISVDAAVIEQAVQVEQFVAEYAEVDVEYRLSFYLVIHGRIMRLIEMHRHRGRCGRQRCRAGDLRRLFSLPLIPVPGPCEVFR